MNTIAGVLNYERGSRASVERSFLRESVVHRGSILVAGDRFRGGGHVSLLSFIVHFGLPRLYYVSKLWV